MANKKSFVQAVQTAATDTSGDPMANFLGATSDYTVADDEVIRPREIAPTLTSSQSFGQGDELNIDAEAVLQRERELSLGDRAFKGTGSEAFTKPSPTPPNQPREVINPEGDGEYEATEEITEERKERRRAVIAKFSAKFIDNIMAGASVAAHSYFVAPDESVMERHTLLMSKVANLSPAEAAELQSLDRTIKRYADMEAQFAEQAKLDQDDNQELQECIRDITSTENVNLHPGWLILIIVGIQLITNAITIFTNRVSMRR